MTTIPNETRNIYPWTYYLPYTSISMIVIILGMSSQGLATSSVFDFYQELIFNNPNTLSSLLFALFIFVLILGIISLLYGLQYIFDIYKRRLEVQHNLQAAIANERIQLLKLFESTNGMHWRDRTRWCDLNEPVGRWYGIKVNAQGRVNKIILPENRLQGPLPQEDFFIHFPCLNEIDLRSNQIDGTIPQEVGQYLHHLQGLYLYDNYLTGDIPDNIADLTHLMGVYLYNNQLHDIERSKELFRSKLPSDCLIFI